MTTRVLGALLAIAAGWGLVATSVAYHEAHDVPGNPCSSVQAFQAFRSTYPTITLNCQ